MVAVVIATVVLVEQDTGVVVEQDIGKLILWLAEAVVAVM